MELPAAAARMLLDTLEQMAIGNAVNLVAVEAELSTQQAADLLHVSRPYVVKMLEEGILPFHKVGSHRRILAKDLLAYKRNSYEQRKKALAELTTEAQELQLGYE